MAESSIFWATTGTGDGGAGGYSAAQLFDLFRGLFTGGSANAGGVAPDYLNKLAVSGTSSPVSVATGVAVVYGIPYFNTAATTIAIPTPSTATRIDRIVLRASWSAQTVRITRIAGTEGAGSAPAMTQSAGTTWDIPLANVSITTGGVITVTDAREFLQNLGDGGVTTAKIADNAITNAKMADNAINTAELVDAAVTLAKQANLAQSTVIGRAASAGTGVPTALTPAQLITILTAADGTGSLLDADRLDGQDGSYYALYAANSPSVDPNSTTDPYIVSNHANVPGGSGFWHIITTRYSTLGIAQIAIEYANVSTPPMYYRNWLTGSGWSTWRKVVTTDSAAFTGAVSIGGAASITGVASIGGSAVTSALLTLTSTTGALLIPRMTTTQRNALTATDGMVIYNTTTAALQCYQSGAWVSLIAPTPWSGGSASFGTNVSGITGPFIKYRNDDSYSGRTVVMYGEVYITTGTASGDKTLFTVSADSVPAMNYSPILCVRSISGTQSVHPCWVETSGAVVIQDYTAGAYYSLRGEWAGVP